MRKNKAPLYTQDPRRKPIAWPVVRALIALVALGPIAYEGGLLIYSQWVRAFGRRAAARTPVLDHFGHLIRSGYTSLMTQFSRVPWHPPAVIVVGVACCAICMILLRGRRSHVE